MRGWNRCDCCCQFFSPDKHGIIQEEYPSMDWNGNVTIEYTTACGRCEPMIHDHPWVERETP